MPTSGKAHISWCPKLNMVNSQPKNPWHVVRLFGQILHFDLLNVIPNFLKYFLKQNILDLWTFTVIMACLMFVQWRMIRWLGYPLVPLIVTCSNDSKPANIIGIHTPAAYFVKFNYWEYITSISRAKQKCTKMGNYFVWLMRIVGLQRPG